MGNSRDLTSDMQFIRDQRTKHRFNPADWAGDCR